MARGRRLLALLLLTVVAGCATVHTPKASIRIAGSDTMLPLNKALAAGYKEHSPQTAVTCTGGGTSAGMHKLIEGKADICAASRPIAPEEVKAMAERHYSIGMAHFVCKDALEIFLYPDNPVEGLQMGQVEAIFSGRIINWRQVGGEDRPIHVYIRPPDSGTHRYFAEHVLQEASYRREAIQVESNVAMRQRILADPVGIGYGGNAYQTGLKICKIDGVAPTPDNVASNHYPLSRYLYFYTLDESIGRIKEFIDWVINPNTQTMIEKSGYCPIWRQ